jgi:hypothetical protein
MIITNYGRIIQSLLISFALMPTQFHLLHTFHFEYFLFIVRPGAITAKRVNIYPITIS